MANVLTPVFRVLHANVFTPKRNDMNGKDEYSLVASFPKDTDFSILKSAAQKALETKFGADKSKWPANLKSPIRSTEERRKEGKLPAGYEEGGFFITLRSTQRPGVVGPDVQDIIDTTDFYSGCFARATVSVYAYDQKGNRGVSFGLQNLQKVRDGDVLSGRTKPTDDFAPLEGADSPATGKSAASLF